MSQAREYTVLSLFCGLGGKTLGFQAAETRLFGTSARFRSIGGIDSDPAACADFEMLTESPSLCVDVGRLSPAELRAFAGPIAPDVVAMSPPCKGYSGLLPPSLAKDKRYTAMNNLAVTAVELLLSTWDQHPRLILLENVPRIASSGAPMLARIAKKLDEAGYAVHMTSHECGELGGLAQVRRRFLLVARHKRRVGALLYRPPKRRVRGCGEVLGELPMPEAPEAGPMHRMPRLSWVNWVRLALIPAGGDHRDLPGVLAAGQARREAWRRSHVEGWEAPSITVTGDGSNGPCAVADPRAGKWFPGVLGVVPWPHPSSTVTAQARPMTGSFSVSDPRLVLDRGDRRPDHCYGVLPWGAPSFTVAGVAHPGCGAYSVADPRVQEMAQGLDCEPRAGAYGVLPWEEAAKTITGSACVDNGPFAVADTRVPGAQPIAIVDDARKSPWVPGEGGKRVKVPVVILAADGTWHRPLTPLELARLQDLPATVSGRPLELHGRSVSAWVERIGNAVPVGTARAIAEQMLLTLLSSDVGAGLAPSGGATWVMPYMEGVH